MNHHTTFRGEGVSRPGCFDGARRLTSALLPLGAAALFAGCAAEAEVHDPVAEACGHLVSGEATSITLGPSFASSASLPVGHQRATLAVVDAVFQDGSTGKGGHGNLAIDEAGTWLVLSSEGVAMKLYGPDGVLVAADSSVKQPASCTQAAKVVTYQLGVGQHTIEFGPTQAASFDLVVEHDDEDAAHGHD